MLEILLFIKMIIYTNAIKVEHNRPQVILISILISTILFAVIRAYGGKKMYIHTFTLYAFLSVLMLINAIYFDQYNSLTSVVVIRLIPQLKIVGDSLKLLVDITKVALIADLPFIFMYKRIKSKSTGIGINNLKRITNIKLIIVSILILSLVIPYYSHTGQMRSIAAQELFLYHSLDIGKNIFEDIDVAAEQVTIEDRIDLIRDRRDLVEGNYTGVGEGKNLLVIQVEALQNFVMFQRYLGEEITPNLNRLAINSSSLYYDNYYQLIGRGNTSDAEFVSQNSLYPSSGEPTYIRYAENNFYGLPWLLRDAGYSAWAYHGYERTFWNRENAYNNIGFQRFVAEDNYIFNEEIGFGITDKDFLDQSIWYLKQQDLMDENPFYAFMVTLSSHTPFFMPEEYKDLQLKSEHRNTILGDYLQAIHYTDQQLGIFIQRLKDEGLYEDTVIALYGDHFAMNATSETDTLLMEEFLKKPYNLDSMMNVPLIIHVPGENLGEKISDLGSQLDFYPTIANIMGIKISKGIIFGQDMNNLRRSQYVFPMNYVKPGSVITEDRFFEMSRDEIFEHSRAFYRDTGQPADIELFRHLSRLALDQIRLSNYILENNLVLE